MSTSGAEWCTAAPPDGEALPLIGRDDDVALVRRQPGGRWGRWPAAVAVEGAAGMGKTRLLRESLAAPGSALPAMVCTCRKLQQAVPFWPLSTGWRQAGRSLPADVAGREPAQVVETWAVGPGTVEALDDLVARQLVVDESDEWGAHYRPAAPALGQAALSMMGGASRERLLERVGAR